MKKFALYINFCIHLYYQNETINTLKLNIMKAIINKIKTYSTELLKEVIINAMSNDKIQQVVLDALLDELETRISEEDFINFCDAL